MKLRRRNQNKRVAIAILDDTEWGPLPAKRLHSLYPEIPDDGLDIDDPDELVHEIRRLAWGRLQHYLAIRERTRRECDQYLRRLPLHPQLRKELLDKAAEYGFQDDRRYAEMVVRASSGKGASLIRFELRHAGVDDKIVDEVLREELPPDREIEQRRARIAKLSRKYASDNPRDRRRKMINALYRLGYSWDDIADDLLTLDSDPDDT
jgi:SOS response regulatory protein OraA/RecX